MPATAEQGAVSQAIERARKHSPFLKAQLETLPLVGEGLVTRPMPEVVAEARRAGEGTADLATSMRRERNALALALGVGDLAGAISLETVFTELSDLADRSLEKAIAAAIEERTPGEPPRGFVIIALGKHGSRELNYSSDIDPIFLFDPDTLPRKPREEAGQAAVRIGQRVVELMQKRDGTGYVFRVDLRLRPSPEATPIALPVDAAISYYESSALPWERAAFIRARVAAGDARLGQYFLDSIHPFIWRRSLDFGAIGEIQSITRRIRDHHVHGQELGPGFDLKRGRGGIREVEFYAQVHQLIHGGRESQLRAPATLDALAALGTEGRIGQEDAVALADAYRLLRTIEHRLQMVDDKQTHALPSGTAELDNVAQLHGLPDASALLDLLRGPVTRVASVYGELVDYDEKRLPTGPEALEAALRKAGFDDAPAARARIEGWRSGRSRSLRSSAAMEAFEAMLPGLIEAFGLAPEPMRAINRFDDIVARLPSGVNFYRLIEAQPALAQLLGTILNHAPALAEQLGRRPELLDGLISKAAFDPAPSVAALAAEFALPDRGQEDYQMLLDRVRRRVNEIRFALGVQLVTASSDPIEVSHGYARVAEAAVTALAAATTEEFAATHGCVPGSELMVVGLGRLGGEGLTHASDLDLIYLFTGSFESVSDGPKPLGATTYYNRLAARITAALSVPTAAGPLYDIDTRLRPSGKDGLLVVSLDSFREYQASQAWTWEHMALTRARPVHGSPEGRAALQAVIDATLRRERDPGKLVSDAVAMRRDMAAHKQPAGPFDIKLGDGGLVDLEFAVHMLQLRHHVGLRPQLDRAIAELIQAGLAPPEIEGAYSLLLRMLVTLRLVSPTAAEPPEASRALVAAACGLPDWDALLAAHAEARQRIRALWQTVAGEGE